MQQASEASPKIRPMAQRSKSGHLADELKELLERVRNLCEELGEGFSEPLTRVAELQQRLAEERFHLAVLGQFKRGKSTLLNALLGEPLLPTGVVPLTSIPTLLRAGETRGVRIIFHDGRQTSYSDLALEQASDVLARHVTEKENPRNRLGVKRVEVEHPSSLLIAGVVLIDTPGIGSTFRHNTEATLNFLAQCDAALFVVSADPPITEVEKAFLTAARGKVAELCFVMNKVDYLSGSELKEAMEFFERTIGEFGYPKSGQIFEVSAKQGIDARVHEERSLWRDSGVERLQNYLLDFLSREKSRTLHIALARKAVDVVANAALNVGLQQRSLQLSRQELESRLIAFDAKVKEIEQEKIKIGDLLAGDRKRTAQHLEDLAETLRREARLHLGELTSKAFQTNENPAGIEWRAREHIAKEIPLFFQSKLASFSGEMNRALQEALNPYQKRLDELISALRSTAAELFDFPYRGTTSNGKLEELHRPYWVTHKWSTSVSPVPEGFLDRFLPPELRKHRLQKRLDEDVDTLVTHNVENLRWATLRNADEAFRRFSINLDKRLKETAEATREATRATHLRQKQNEDMAAPEIVRLGKKAGELAELETLFSQYAESL
jgi:GTPase Era involved in 16S rRNA processing